MPKVHNGDTTPGHQTLAHQQSSRARSREPYSAQSGRTAGGCATGAAAATACSRQRSWTSCKTGARPHVAASMCPKTQHDRLRTNYDLSSLVCALSVDGVGASSET